ncbi:hypothetical protein [Maribacter sp. 2304DJ31-5]|uniref:hypothetical protein n=1 Tax=Maribacter sp. 2304DJ31-5 TaxID=3386273 RepID=UPI0039BD12B2
MKKYFLSLIMVSLLLFSCSSDKDENNMDDPSTSIVGIWDATELVINDATASDEAIFGREILDFLTDRNCTIITLRFNEDLTAEASNSANYVEVNATSSGLDIPCPSQSDVESSTYTYDGSVVSFVDLDGATVNVDVTIEDDVMTVDAADLEIPNFNESGNLIFRKR